MSSIERFIARFRGSETAPYIEEQFMNGCCYWFAFVLYTRFSGSKIMYSDHQNHFATKINGVLYDIRGAVSDPEDYVPWEDFKSIDSSHTANLVRNCINF